MPSAGWIADAGLVVAVFVAVLAPVLEATPSGASRASAAAGRSALRRLPRVLVLPRGRGLGVDALDMLNSLSKAVG
ncbi:hypothetical protein BCY76_004555 [Nesterenkonia sp. PF2B19]|nr:hypothetical protein BCY76_004555 [Nesterenkonia sp. PF2B19]